MATSVTRTTYAVDDATSTVQPPIVIKAVLRGGRWHVDGVAKPLDEQAMWRRMGRVRAWEMTAFDLDGLAPADLIPHLRFANGTEGREVWWPEIGGIPSDFELWEEPGGTVPDTDEHPIAIDGQPWLRQGGLLCPLVHADIDVDETWALARWNNEGAMPLGADLVLFAGPLAGQGIVTMRHDDPDQYDAYDVRAWRCPRARSRADCAFALMDKILDFVGEWNWHTRSLYEAVLLLKTSDPTFEFDIHRWNFEQGGYIDDGEVFDVFFAVGPDDHAEVRRRVERSAGRRFVRWILEAAPRNGLATRPTDELLADMQLVDGGVLQAPHTGLAWALREISAPEATRAWIKAADDEPSTLIRTQSMDAQLAVITRGGAVEPCRAIPCRWESRRAVGRADDRFLTWFVESCATPELLLDPRARWQVETAPGTTAHRALVEAVAAGLAAGLGSGFGLDETTEPEAALAALRSCQSALAAV